MSMPKAYSPVLGQKYQIFVKRPNSKELEHCNYATSHKEKNALIREYKTVYGNGYSFSFKKLPKKFWEVA